MAEDMKFYIEPKPQRSTDKRKKKGCESNVIMRNLLKNSRSDEYMDSFNGVSNFDIYGRNFISEDIKDYSNYNSSSGTNLSNGRGLGRGSIFRKKEQQTNPGISIKNGKSATLSMPLIDKPITHQMREILGNTYSDNGLQNYLPTSPLNSDEYGDVITYSSSRSSSRSSSKQSFLDTSDYKTDDSIEEHSSIDRHLKSRNRKGSRSKRDQAMTSDSFCKKSSININANDSGFEHSKSVSEINRRLSKVAIKDKSDWNPAENSNFILDLDDFPEL